jgi:hypothetical protein
MTRSTKVTGSSPVMTKFFAPTKKAPPKRSL